MTDESLLARLKATRAKMARDLRDVDAAITALNKVTAHLETGPRVRVGPATVDYVRQNPGCTSVEVTDALEAMGASASSANPRAAIGVTIAQKVRQGQIIKNGDGRLFAAQRSA